MIRGDEVFPNTDTDNQRTAGAGADQAIGSVFTEHGKTEGPVELGDGGPHRVAEWLDQRGNMPLDEFVEEIPYDQAREYTKKVTRFISLFLRTYEGVSTLYIGQNIDRAYKAQPNF